MSLLRGKLFAGALFAGALLGGQSEIIIPPTIHAESSLFGGSYLPEPVRKKSAVTWRQKEDESLLILLL